MVGHRGPHRGIGEMLGVWGMLPPLHVHYSTVQYLYRSRTVASVVVRGIHSPMTHSSLSSYYLSTSQSTWREGLVLWPFAR